MNTLIVYTHPYDGSFNNHVLNTVKETRLEQGENVDIIDLYADNFDGIMRAEDLKLFGQGRYADELAEGYMNRLKAADEVIFIFPVWWYGTPAMLKGFFDKVLLKGHTYTQDENKNMKGLLNISKSSVFTTASITKEIMGYVGSPVEKTLIGGIFSMVGIENTTWIHCPTVHLEEARSNFLVEVAEYLK